MQHGCCFTTVWRPLLKTSVTTLDDFFQSCGLSDPCSPASTVAAIPAVAVKDQYIALLPKVLPFVLRARSVRGSVGAAAPMGVAHHRIGRRIAAGRCWAGPRLDGSTRLQAVCAGPQGTVGPSPLLYTNATAYAPISVLYTNATAYAAISRH